MALMGLAGAGGKAIDESIEYVRGKNLQTGGQVAGDIDEPLPHHASAQVWDRAEGVTAITRRMRPVFARGVRCSKPVHSLDCPRPTPSLQCLTLHETVDSGVWRAILIQ